MIYFKFLLKKRRIQYFPNLFNNKILKVNMKDLNYDLTHIILYSFALFHYIIITYNPKLNIFNLYDDSKVVECDTFTEIVEMITANLIAQNLYYYFYPVLLIYSKYDLYNYY